VCRVADVVGDNGGDEWMYGGNDGGGEDMCGEDGVGDDVHDDANDYCADGIR